MQEDRPLLVLEEFERLDQRGNVVSVDRAKVLEPQLLEDDTGPKHSLGDLFGLARHLQGRHAAHLLHELSGALMEIIEARAGDDLVQVGGNRPDVLVDGPLVIVEDHNQPLGMVRNIVEGLVRDSARKRRVAGNRDDVFFTAGPVTGGSHAERG
jgi:hypothetical protein